ncbi:MAG: DUF445 family protein [Firmicutes bacterium]|nr:DUF445 family protein [Bacillota bacterium]
MGALARALLSPPVVNFVLLPALGAVHGWATNTLAVWLLFRPLTPWRLPLVGWSVQGLLPRRQPDLARTVGQAVERELVNWEELAASLSAPEVVEQLGSKVEELVHARVAALLPGWVPAAWREALAVGAAAAVGREAAAGLVALLPQAAALARDRLPVARMVEMRVAAFSPAEFERLVRRAAASELRAIVLLGLGMGLVIGLAQGAFLALIGQ